MRIPSRRAARFRGPAAPPIRPGTAAPGSAAPARAASRPPAGAAEQDAADLGAEAAGRLARLIRCRTVSSRNAAEVDTGEFEAFIAELRQLYPTAHAVLEHERVNGYGLLFRWPGRADGQPVVLMAHYDVVPVADADGWMHPPFSGAVADGFIWGRGTLDDKGALAAIMDAVEALAADGFVPARDVYLSFGNNEETAGDTAAAAAALLAARGVRPWLVLDEGGAVASQAFPLIAAPMAVIGVSEKGILDVELSAEDPGGHASTPRRGGATARLARAILRIDRRPFPVLLPDVPVEMLHRLAPAAPLPLRPVLRRAHRLRPALAAAFSRLGGEPAAMVRTTAAVTELRGAPASNVLATRASANVNIRVAVGEDIAGTLDRLRRMIADPSIALRVVEGTEPSPVSGTANDQFRLLEETVAAVFPDAVPAPYIMLGGSDARRFTGISDTVYRFAPFRMDAAARASIHADNERLGVEAFGEGILFYRRLLQALPAARQ